MVPIKVGEESGTSMGPIDEVTQGQGLEVETQVCLATKVESGD